LLAPDILKMFDGLAFTAGRGAMLDQRLLRLSDHAGPWLDGEA
jgi:hypothetical protein